MRSIGFPELLVILGMSVILAVFAVLPFWKIFSKAGYPGVMGLAMVVPILNIIMVFYLGFADWPILRELEALRSRGR
jgi:uncharacterized membrane protein